MSQQMVGKAVSCVKITLTGDKMSIARHTKKGEGINPGYAFPHFLISSEVTLEPPHYYQSLYSR